MCLCVFVFFFPSICLLSHDYRWFKIEAYLKLNLFSFHYVRLVDNVCVCIGRVKGVNIAGQGFHSDFEAPQPLILSKRKQ